MITLKKDNETITLPPDLAWIDEEWQPVAQQTEYSLTGALIVETSIKQSGRPITLASPESQAITTKAIVDTLRSWASIAGKTFTLNIDGVNKNVIFRHQDGVAVQTEILGYWRRPISGNAVFRITLRFMEIIT